METKPKFAFLSSTRFWALVIGAIAFYLQAKQFIGDAEMVLINTIMGGFIGINTIDRTVDKMTATSGAKKSK